VNDQYWYSVKHENKKVGYYSLSHEENEGAYITQSKLFVLLRGHRKTEPFTVSIKMTESDDGLPLYFSRRTRAGHMDITTAGEVDGLRVKTSVNRNGIKTEKVVLLEKSFTFPHTHKKALLSAIYQNKNTLIRSSLDLSRIKVRNENLHITSIQNAKSSEAFQIERFIEGAQNERSVSHIDDKGIPLRLEIDLLGSKLVFERTNELEAIKKIKPISFLKSLTIKSPHRIPAHFLKKPIRYKLNSPGNTALPQSSEQVVVSNDETVSVTVCQSGVCGIDKPLTASDRNKFLLPNEWVQSDHPEIRNAAKRFENIANKRRRMERIAQFVKKRMDHNKYEFIGDTSALEALRSGNGDCSEYALLTVALLRATGVPARVASGIAYSTEFANQRHVFAPHAWAQAWVDNRWHSIDTAKEGFGSGHIAFHYGHGDPHEIRRNLRTFENAKIDSAAVLRKNEN